MPTIFPNSPRLLRGGIVTMAVDTSTVLSVIALQYNPSFLSRSLQIQSTPGGQDGDPSRCPPPPRSGDRNDQT